MTEITDKEWYAMSDTAYLTLIGDFTRKARLQQNKTQQQVAAAAGIARSTLVKIENGHGGTLISFVEIMRTLEQLHQLKIFQIKEQVSPLLLAKMEKAKRQRARNKNDNTIQKEQSNW